MLFVINSMNAKLTKQRVLFLLLLEITSFKWDVLSIYMNFMMKMSSEKSSGAYFFLLLRTPQLLGKVIQFSSFFFLLNLVLIINWHKINWWSLFLALLSRRFAVFDSYLLRNFFAVETNWDWNNHKWFQFQ